MDSIRRVVAAYDGTPSAGPALDLAVDVAADRAVPLHVVTAIDVDPGIPQPWVHLPPGVERAVQDGVDEARRRLGADRVSSDVVPGVPADVLLHSLQPGDLAVMGSHSHHGVARLVLGSTSRSVATHASVPVTVVRPEGGRGERVVVGVDGSELSAAAVDFAADEAERRGLPLRAVLVVPEQRSPSGDVSGPDDPRLQAAEATVHESLAGLRVDHPDLDVEAFVMQGTPSEALLGHARDAELLVVGSRGRGALRSLLLGSVGADLLDRAPCAVSVVR